MMQAFNKELYKTAISLEMIKNKKSCDTHYHFCFDTYSTWLIVGLCVNYILTTDHGIDQSVVILNTACVHLIVGWCEKLGWLQKTVSE